MGDLTESIGVGPIKEGLLNRLASIQLRIGWEVAAYAALMAVAAGMRFWDLGSRSLNHDESIHGLFSWRLFEGMGYDHFPLAHGPFQFFGTAFSFVLFGGASDYTLRILPAIFGSALVALLLLLRHRLGTIGALLAAAAIAFSPTLLFFSRFARNDIYVVFFTLGLVICLWRYIDERKHRYLYVAALLLGLSFATKENTFINVAILIAFLNLWLAVHFWRQIDRKTNLSSLGSYLTLLSLIPFAWAVAALWPFVKGLRERVGLSEGHPAADFLIVLGTLSLPQFAAAIQVPLDALFGIGEGQLATVIWSDTRVGPIDLGTTTRENLLGLGTVVGLIAATAIIGLRWNARAWLLIAVAFYVPYVLLYTSFFTNIDGFYSGNWGSLDYWLGQQDVRRGNQPWFYYLMLLPSYEFLPLLLAAPALFYYAVKGDVFRRFLVFWVVATIFGYSMAGEKMPWISVHTSLPIIILGTFFLGQLLQRLPARGIVLWPSSYLLPVVAGALGLTAVAVGVFGPDSGPWLALRIVTVSVAVVAILWLLLPLAVQRATTVMVSAAVGGLLVFTIFIGVRAAFQLGDVPRELYVYAQGSPDVPDLVAAIDETATRSGLDRDLPIVVDGGLEPWGWYLRDYNHVSYTNLSEGYEPPPDAVVLAKVENDSLLEPYLEQYEEPQRFVVIWWFPEFDTYKTLPTTEYQTWSASPGFIDGVVTDFAPEFVESLFRAGTLEQLVALHPRPRSRRSVEPSEGDGGLLPKGVDER